MTAKLAKPSAVLDRWARLGKDQGHYCLFAGFERDLQKSGGEALSLAYDDLDIYAQIGLFGWIVDLLCEEHYGGGE